MDIKKEIEVGDIVDVYFDFDERVGRFGCKVLHSPSATGDSWRLIDKDGELVYIQQFQMMKLTPERERIAYGY